MESTSQPPRGPADRLEASARARALARGATSTGALAIALASMIAAGAGAQRADDLAVQVWVQDPSGHALDRLHAALRRAETGRGRARIMVWGASHTASDQFTGDLRAQLQARFGDAGAGLVMPARAFPLYDHRLVGVAEPGAWRTLLVNGRRRANDAYGVLGFALETTSRADASIELRRGAPPSDTATLLYLRQPRGGRLELRTNDDEPPRVVETRGPRGPDEVEITSPRGVRRLRLRATGDGPVRIFGISLERRRSGVIVDAMGVPGARLRDRLPWEDDVLRSQLALLSPDLIVLAYGTNESGFRGRSLRLYRQDVEDAVRRARAGAPEASCLLIGPSDWPVRGNDGAFTARTRTADVVEIQRDAARRHGCGFFDLVAFQGGPVSMPRWVEAGLALEDHVHFTDEGHRVLARGLSRALLRGVTTSAGGRTE